MDVQNRVGSHWLQRSPASGTRVERACSAPLDQLQVILSCVTRLDRAFILMHSTARTIGPSTPYHMILN